MKALLLENIHPHAESALEAAGYEVHQRPRSLDEDELVAALDGVELLGIRSNTALSARAIERAGSLRAVGCFCIGTNQVDLDAATTAGLAVFNAPYSNARSVVELVVAEILALSRRLVSKTNQLHAGVWDKSARGSHEVRGRTLGIVGYGNIGTQLATVAEALGMRVLFYDVADRPAHGGARRVANLHDLLAQSDFVSLHVDGRPGNAGLFGAAELAAMPRGSVFINASRGMVVDDLALRDALVSGHLAGAALDVFPIEPKAQGDRFVSDLQGLDNVILTPHVAASTLEAQAEIGQFVADKLLGFVRDASTSLSVNLPAVVVPPLRSGTRVACLYDLGTTPVVAELGNAVAASGRNITAQHMSTRDDLGYVVTDVDGDPPDAIFEQLRSVPAVRWVTGSRTPWLPATSTRRQLTGTAGGWPRPPR